MDVVRPTDLKTGDVLLVRGSGLFSRFIRFFDGGTYSHAAIYDGTKVVEAECREGNGIEQNPVAKTAAGAEFVDVYRFIANDRKQLGGPDYP